MKTFDEIKEKYGSNVRIMTADQAKEIAQEYAEEYAKAFLIWTRNNKTYPMDAQTCLESFKESLKKINRRTAVKLND